MLLFLVIYHIDTDITMEKLIKMDRFEYENYVRSIVSYNILGRFL